MEQIIYLLLKKKRKKKTMQTKITKKQKFNEKQKEENMFVFDEMNVAFDSFNDFLRAYYPIETKFRNCNAKIIGTHYYIYLQSYDTIVAFIDKETGFCFDILRYVYGYTATSAQHIAKFKKDYSQYITKEFTYRDLK